jgi:hypothetical protein
MNEYFVIVKLVSGEQVMATLTDEDEGYVELHHPMVIRMVPFINNGKAHEHVTAAPLCQFSDDSYFRIPRSNIMFVKKLHEVLVPHYNRIVSDHEATVLVKHDNQGNVKRAEDLVWEDEEDIDSLTTEEIQKRIDMLESIADKQEEEVTTFVEGNDTVH